jgi:hypothetical protein
VHEVRCIGAGRASGEKAQQPAAVTLIELGKPLVYIQCAVLRRKRVVGSDLRIGVGPTAASPIVRSLTWGIVRPHSSTSRCEARPARAGC